MRAYETMFVLAPTLDDAGVEAAIERLSGVITEQGGDITHVDRWGRRRLAYEIDGHKDGYYTVISFLAEAGATAELERIMRISDGVLRFVVVRQVPTKRPPVAEETPAATPEETPTETPEAAAEPNPASEAAPAGESPPGV